MMISVSKIGTREISWKQWGILLLLIVVLINVGLRSDAIRKGESIFGRSAVSASSVSSISPVVRTRQVDTAILSQALNPSLPAAMPDLEPSLSDLNTGNQQKKLIETVTSRYHELPWHFTSLLESLNGIMSAETDLLGVYVAEAQLVDVPLFQQVLLRAIFQRWSEVGVLDMIDFISGQADFNDPYFNQLLADEATTVLVLVAKQHDSPEDLLDLMISSKSKSQIVAALLAIWVSTDPNAAMLWVQKNNNQGFLDRHLPTILLALIDSEPEIARQHIHQLPIAQQNAYLAQLEQSKSTPTVPVDSPQQAIERLGELPQEQRQARQEDILMQWFTEDAAAAASWIAQTQDPMMLMSLENMVADLPRIDLAAAQDVFHTLDPSLQQQVVEGIARESALKGESATQAWVESLDNISHRFLAESAILQVTLENDPQRALQMANNYFGANRLEYLQIAVTGVSHSKPELLDSWLAAAALTQAERFQLESLVRF